MATISAAVTADDSVFELSASLGVADANDPTSAYLAKIGTETVLVYATSDDGLQARVTRGASGTTAADHASGTTISAYGSLVALFTKAGAISDADFPAGDLPPVGFIGYDTTNHKLYVREGAATWKSSAALA